MRRKKRDLIDDLKTAYSLLAEVMENPSKLFDFQKEVDSEIKKITYKILNKIGFDKLPDGME